MLLLSFFNSLSVCLMAAAAEFGTIPFGNESESLILLLLDSGQISAPLPYEDDKEIIGVFFVVLTRVVLRMCICDFLLVVVSEALGKNTLSTVAIVEWKPCVKHICRSSDINVVKVTTRVKDVKADFLR